MKRLYILFALLLISAASFGQAKKPTIMVVPSENWCNQNNFTMQFDNQGVTQIIPDYQRALVSDVNLKLAIDKIGILMAERGYPLKKLDEAINQINRRSADLNTIRSKTSGASVAENPNDRVQRYAKADIMMELTWIVNKIGPKYSVTYDLAGKDAYTGKQIAGAQGTGPQSFSAELPVLIEEAVMANMDGFCNQLMSYFEDIKENGREVAVDILVFDNGNGLDLESEFDGVELAEIIDNWMSDNTVNNVFSKLDGSETYIQYEQVRIPLYDGKGRQMDTESFVKDLRKYLNSTFNIECKVMPRGLGRCILALGEK